MGEESRMNEESRMIEERRMREESRKENESLSSFLPSILLPSIGMEGLELQL